MSAASTGLRPVLKWVGGKAWLADRVRALLPARVAGTYYEPFAGGLAVFGSLRPEQLPLFDEPGRQHVPAHRARVCDLSAPLVAFYEVLRDCPEAVVRAATDLRDAYLLLGEEGRAEMFALVRREANADPDRSSAISAARYLFLNKTGYNGLMRYNQSGELNTPHGRYKSPRVLDADHLRAFSRALRGVAISREDFEAALAPAGPGDAAYLDPPHATRSATSRFTAYTERPWREEDDERVARAFWDLAERGVRVVLSQADTPRARAALRRLRPAGAAWQAEVVWRRNSVSCRGDGRGEVGEILAAAGPAEGARR